MPWDLIRRRKLNKRKSSCMPMKVVIFCSTLVTNLKSNFSLNSRFRHSVPREMGLIIAKIDNSQMTTHYLSFP